MIQQKNAAEHISIPVVQVWTTNNGANNGSAMPDGLSSQVTQHATELDHGFLSVVRFFLLQIMLTI